MPALATTSSLRFLRDGRRALIVAAGAFVLILPTHAQWTKLEGPSGGSVTGLVQVGHRLLATDEGTACYLSSDSGTTWQDARPWLPDTVCTSAATMGAKIFIGTSRGVYVSSDLGDHWSPFGMDGRWVNICATRQAVLASDGKGIFRSGPDTAVWVKSDSGLGKGATLKSWGDTVFAVTSDYQIYRNLSGGFDVWRQKQPPGYLPKDVAFVDSSLLVASWSGIARSTDLGASWTEFVSTDSMNYYLANNLACLATQGHRVLLGTIEGGVIAFEFAGQKLTLADVSLPWRSVFAFSQSDSLLWAATNGGVFRSRDFGQHWEPARQGILGARPCVLLSSVDTLFLATSEDIYFSTDVGAHWELTDTLARGLELQNMTKIGPTLVGYAPYGLFWSTVRGTSWTRGNMPRYWDGPKWPMLSTGGTVLTAYRDSGVYRSTDQGENWQACSPRGRLWSFTAIGGRVYASGTFPGSTSTLMFSDDQGSSWTFQQSGFGPGVLGSVNGRILFYDYGPGKWYFSDNGITWSPAQGPIEEMSDIQSTGSYAFALCHDHFQFSGDLGQTWHTVDSVFRGGWILTMAIYKGYLYAGLSGTIYRPTRGELWRRPISDIINSAPEYASLLPSVVSLAQNYPNPFNPTTTIRYSLPHRAQVTLDVFNTLGQKVAEPVNGDFDAGSHEVQFNATNLATGVYFYRLQTGSFVYVKKLCVLH